MAKYLVTGGAGFIGSHLTEALLEAGHTVSILDDLSTGKRENVPQGAELIVGDITDYETVANALQDAQGCYHLAAIASVQRSNEDWLGTHRVNLTGSIHVFEAARHADNGPIPVVYASSAAVFGEPVEEPLTESSLTAPLTAYGADKLGSELHAKVATCVHNVPTVGLRFFNVYGPRQDPSSPYSGVISIFADRFLQGKDIEIHGTGEQVRDFIFVADVVAHLTASMGYAENSTPRAEVFNVCTGKATSIKELAQTIKKICPAAESASIEYGPTRTGDIERSIGAPSHANEVLSLNDRVPLEQGLAKLLDSI